MFLARLTEDSGRSVAKLSPELEAHEQMEDACRYEPSVSSRPGGKGSKSGGVETEAQAEVDKV